eukprot:gene21192-21123_t
MSIQNVVRTVDKPFTVYGAAGSGSVPVEAALTLLGLPYRVVEAPAWERDASVQATIGRVNPMHQIPALALASDEIMTESAAILTWLADSHPEGGLAPGLGDAKRPAFLRWMSF